MTAARHQAHTVGFVSSSDQIARLLLAMLVLASLDATAALCLKEAVLQKQPLLAVAGIMLMVAVAGVLLATVKLASLTIVGLGWIVLFQAAVMLVDHLRYDITPGRVQGIAILVAMGALVVACVAPAAGQSWPGRKPTVTIPAQREPSLEDKLKDYVREQWEGHRHENAN
jgi:hypothetical protein